MKINYLTANEEFNHAVWNILNEIQRKRLFSSDKQVIDLMVNININHLSQSRFYEIKNFLEENKIIKEIDEPIDYESKGSKSSDDEFYRIFKFKILKPFDEYYKKYTDLVNGGIDTTKLFGFENNTFWLKLTDGSKATINFNPKGTRKHPTQPYYLLKAFIHSIKAGGWVRKGSWLEISLTTKQIIEEIKKLHFNKPEALNSYLISNMRNNLNQGLPSDFKNLIQLSTYNRKSGTYSFSLKISS